MFIGFVFSAELFIFLQGIYRPSQMYMLQMMHLHPLVIYSTAQYSHIHHWQTYCIAWPTPFSHLQHVGFNTVHLHIFCFVKMFLILTKVLFWLFNFAYTLLSFLLLYHVTNTSYFAPITNDWKINCIPTFLSNIVLFQYFSSFIFSFIYKFLSTMFVHLTHSLSV